MAKKEPPAPTSSALRQTVIGTRNILIGTVGIGATISINADDPALRAAAELLRQARVATNGEEYDKALGPAVTALEEFRQLNQPAELELALQTVGYASFQRFKQTRAKNLLSKHAIPAFNELAEIWAGSDSNKPKSGEAFAYLAWCQYWVGNNTGARAMSDSASEALGSNHELARWATQAAHRAKIVEETKSVGFGIWGTAVVIGIMTVITIVLLAILNRVLQ